MKAGILKYLICYLIEKEHRFVFDTCYICYEDKKYQPLTLMQKIRVWVFSNILYYIFKDYRQCLRWWIKAKNDDYKRYINYWL